MTSLDAPASAQSVDHLDLRRANLGLVLRWLRDHGPRSRATLASELGMTRSTVSTLVAELAERGLVREGKVQRASVGRPSTAVELDGSRVYGLGAELNVNHVSVLALDLAGRTIGERRLALDARALDAEVVVDHLVRLVTETVEELGGGDRHTAGLTVGVAGLVDRRRDLLTHGPNLGWFDVPVGELIRRRLDGSFPVRIDNEGNLAAMAEATPGVADRQDILVIFGEVGVGGGIVADGRLLRGRHGYAGEFGHIIVQPRGRTCGCGRTGCWETVSGLRALLELVAEPHDPIRNPTLGLDERLAEINRRAGLDDARTLDALEQVGTWVGVGAAILANALNPAAIVLSGYYSAVGHHMRAAVEREIGAGVLAVDAGGTRVEISTMGFAAAVRGGAMAALDPVFAAPSVIPRRPHPAAPVGEVVA
ncbi:ROK family protein [Nocardioides sp. dk4132]|uniref:ROK family transcriptional regulator n=1 Tax=unclassified Nocardioides TaxID=2615069 RepID=UPI001294ED92|nr:MULTISPECIES: ROK family transcriptional regulator [unclassified Nocardioides]MQW74968.1 ROK family protein [Nocardioides sp. dk4132]QGA07848.1 ROK family protein [Nocardioides sp. dk884]